MKEKDNRIIFMGTPDFAVFILKALVDSGKNIVSVITAPDKPAGRGQQLNQSPVKKFALEQQLPILQPSNLKDTSFTQELSELNADLFVVVAFRMLPESVWSMPPKGTINLHASLLPNYRGAAPINWAVINGEQETGVTTFFIEKEIDTGKVIEREKLMIGENETAGELHDRLMELGATLTVSTVDKILNGHVEGIPQIELTTSEPKNAPKIFKEDCRINWSRSSSEVHNFIRGLSPYPTAWTILKNQKGETKSFKIFNSIKTTRIPSNPFEISETKEGLLFPCADHYILVTELQPEGKRRMSFKEFLAGNKLSDWKIEH